MRKKRPAPRCVNLEVAQWHERDRMSVVVSTKSGKSVAEWWDDDVASMVEDGFFKSPRRPWPRYGDDIVDRASVLKYLADMGVCRPGASQQIARSALGRPARRRHPRGA